MSYKTYIVINRITQEKHFSFAPSAQEACEERGWLIGDCYIELSPQPLHDPHKYDYLKEEEQGGEA